MLFSKLSLKLLKTIENSKMPRALIFHSKLGKMSKSQGLGMSYLCIFVVVGQMIKRLSRLSMSDMSVLFISSLQTALGFVVFHRVRKALPL